MGEIQNIMMKAKNVNYMLKVRISKDFRLKFKHSILKGIITTLMRSFRNYTHIRIYEIRMISGRTCVFL